MTTSSKTELLEVLRAMLGEFSEAYTVRRIGLFGSFARGDQSDGSDVDILVEFDEPTFDHYMDLKFHLEEVFGRSVDLVLADTVKARLKPIVEKEAVYAWGSPSLPGRHPRSDQQHSQLHRRDGGRG